MPSPEDVGRIEPKGAIRHLGGLTADYADANPPYELQRAGRIDRTLMVRLQARYLRETRP
jgi:hypothetical protein